MPPTLEEIARQAGVAKSTVSMTLRNHPQAQRFSAETRRRIIEVAEQLSYRPNFFATALSSSHSSLLMLGLSFLGDSWASRVAAGFEEEASRRGFRVLITAFREKEDPVAFNRAILGPQGVTSLAVVGGAQTKFTDDAVRQLADEGVSIVAVNRQINHPHVSEIVIDNRLGGRLAAEHLYDRGVERLWIVTQRASLASAQLKERVAGAMAVAAERGKPEPRVVDFAGGLLAGDPVREAVTAALEGEKPDGLFAVGDIFAVSACHALRAKGHEIGRDVLVVGFDGGVYSTCHYPPLTSVAQPTLEMGRRAAGMLVEAMGEKALLGQRVQVEPTLMVRESTGEGRVV